MKIIHKKISDSIELSTLTTDKFKVALINFSINIPLTKEALVYTNLISHLMRRGSSSLPSVSLFNKKLDELYGSYLEIKCSKRGKNIFFTINAEILDNKYIFEKSDLLHQISKLIYELLYAPAFMQKDFPISAFEHEKKLIIDTIKSEINNPRIYSMKRCVEIMNEGLIEVPDSKEFISIIENADFDTLKAHYKRLISTAPIKIFYVGSESAENVAQNISTVFSEINKAEYISTPIVPTPLRREAYAFDSEKMAVSQGNLALAFSTGTNIFTDEDRCYTMMVLNEIFGGTASSKLFLNVRERLSLCYRCSSSFSMNSGLILVSTAFELKNYEKVKAEILKQLDDIKNRVISNEELDAAKKSILNSYRQLKDNPFDIQSFFNTRTLFGINCDLERTIRKISEVSIDDICAVAAAITLDASFLIEGDQKTTEDINDD